MAYATTYDIADQWRSLSATEEIRAEALLDLAADLIEHHVDMTGVVASDAKWRAARQVSIEMVVEALPFRRAGVSSYSVQLDGAVESATYRDSEGASTIVLTKAMLALFGSGLTVATTPKWSFGDCS